MLVSAPTTAITSDENVTYTRSLLLEPALCYTNADFRAGFIFDTLDEAGYIPEYLDCEVNSLINDITEILTPVTTRIPPMLSWDEATIVAGQIIMTISQHAL